MLYSFLFLFSFLFLCGNIHEIRAQVGGNEIYKQVSTTEAESDEECSSLIDLLRNREGKYSKKFQSFVNSHCSFELEDAAGSQSDEPFEAPGRQFFPRSLTKQNSGSGLDSKQANENNEPGRVSSEEDVTMLGRQRKKRQDDDDPNNEDGVVEYTVTREKAYEAFRTFLNLSSTGRAQTPSSLFFLFSLLPSEVTRESCNQLNTNSTTSNITTNSTSNPFSSCLSASTLDSEVMVIDISFVMADLLLFLQSEVKELVFDSSSDQIQLQAPFPLSVAINLRNLLSNATDLSSTNTSATFQTNTTSSSPFTSLSLLKNLKVLTMSSVSSLNTFEFLSSLSLLVQLSLPSNNISAYKLSPSSFSSLSSLSLLNLTGNLLDAVPLNFLPLFHNLNSLDLSSNPLVYLPEDLYRLSTLQALSVSFTQLFDLPSNFSHLASLRSFSAEGSKLRTLPSDFGLLSSLLMLQLASCRLSTLPSSFTQLNNLQILNLTNNLFSSLSPALLIPLQNLRTLDLSTNYLTSDNWSTLVPYGNSTSPFSSLESLNLSQNLLDQYPPFISSLPRLKYLSLGSNQFTSISPDFRNLTLLLSLDLQSNRLSSLPSGFIFPTSLTFVNLNSNQLIALPNSTSLLISLEKFTAVNNVLPSLPHRFGNFPKLRELDLQGNRITTIPSTLANCTSLEILSLARNLIPDLPFSFSSFPNLQSLSLFRNSLRDLQGSLSSLAYLYLQQNNFTRIPTSVTTATQLRVLDLSRNQLPSANLRRLVGMSSLIKLDVSRNLISSYSFPDGDLGSLAIMDLSKNPLNVDFASFIDRNRKFLSSITIMGLSDCKLRGTFPTTLPPFQSLYADKNYLVGTFSLASIVNGTNLSQLKILDVSANQLSGAISSVLPATFVTSLQGLYSVNLNQNSFYGNLNGTFMKSSDFNMRLTVSQNGISCLGLPKWCAGSEYGGNGECYPCVSPCGDGVRYELEECDDGNNQNGDGCSSICLIEPGWSCYNPPRSTVNSTFIVPIFTVCQQNDNSQETYTILIAIIIPVIGFVIAFLIVIYALYRLKTKREDLVYHLKKKLRLQNSDFLIMQEELELIEKIGEGNFGTVLLGVLRYTTEVAVKELKHDDVISISTNDSGSKDTTSLSPTSTPTPTPPHPKNSVKSRAESPSRSNTSYTYAQGHTELTQNETIQDSKPEEKVVHTSPQPRVIEMDANAAARKLKKDTIKANAAAIHQIHSKTFADFLSEAQLISSIPPHPNIVQFLGVCVTHHGSLLIVTQYVPNRSLQRYLYNHDRPISTPLLVEAALGIASGMNHLARHNVIHNDLSARNILVEEVIIRGDLGDTWFVGKAIDAIIGRSGHDRARTKLVAKVTDFGLATSVKKRKKDNSFPIRWTAPEVIREARAVSFNSDVWSFGVVIYEIFTMCKLVPYHGMSNQMVVERVQSGWRLDKPPLCPASVYHLMLACWAMDPTQRPSFLKICKRLQEVLKMGLFDTLEADRASLRGLGRPSVPGRPPLMEEVRLGSLGQFNTAEVAETAAGTLLYPLPSPAASSAGPPSSKSPIYENRANTISVDIPTQNSFTHHNNQILHRQDERAREKNPEDDQATYIKYSRGHNNTVSTLV